MEHWLLRRNIFKWGLPAPRNPFEKFIYNYTELYTLHWCTMAQAILQQKRATQERIFQILFENDEITWKQIIFGLIETEEMDPWDIDISRIAQQFLKMLKTLKRLDFRISGKMVLASAILLKMKSTKLVDEEIAALDQLINSADEPVTLFDDFPVDGSLLIQAEAPEERPRLVPRTPQPRKRKVSVYDLVEALEQALEVDANRVRFQPRILQEATLPDNPLDMGQLIRHVYDKVNKHYKGRNAVMLTFEELVPSDAKEDKVLTFIPLLHLDFQRKLDMLQDEHFGPISIKLLQRNATFSEEELAAK
jgi:segregation and condensation protein A